MLNSTYIFIIMMSIYIMIPCSSFITTTNTQEWTGSSKLCIVLINDPPCWSTIKPAMPHQSNILHKCKRRCNRMGNYHLHVIKVKVLTQWMAPLRETAYNLFHITIVLYSTNIQWGQTIKNPSRCFCFWSAIQTWRWLTRSRRGQ